MNHLPLLHLLLAVLVGSAAAQERIDLERLPGGGVACFTAVEHLDQALSLAGRPGWLVHVLLEDPIQVHALRRSADEAGLLGRRLVVEQGMPEPLPHADHLLDLLVAGPGMSEAEALRVIAPIRGQAFLGDRRLTKPELPGSDWWTHRAHHADNNPVSRDTAFATPAMVQHIAMPFYTSYQGSLLVADGIRVECYDWVLRYSGAHGIAAMAGKLVGRSVYNGQVLWMRELPEGIKPAAQIGAIHGGRVYLADGHPGRVLVFDLATGADLPAIEAVPDATDRWVSWLGIVEGRLHLLLTDGRWRAGSGSSLMRTPWDLAATTQAQPTAIEDDDEGAGEREALGPQGPWAGPDLTSLMVCWDIAGGRVLWQHEDAGSIDFRVIGVDEDRRTYAFSPVNGLFCLGQDGKAIWSNRDPVWFDRILTDPRRRNTNLFASSSLLIGPQTIMFAQTGNLDTKQALGWAFARDDGRLLWQRDSDYRPVRAAIPADGILRISRGTWNALTGERMEGEEAHRFGHCGHWAWVPAVGMMGHVSFNFKSPCAIPPIAAGGLLHYFPSVCSCVGHERGAAAYASDAKILERIAGGGEHPLHIGPARRVTIQDAPGDWPQYRGDGHRLGAATLAAPATASLLSHSPLGVPLPVPEGHGENRWEWLDRPTPPTTAGGLAFYGTSEGRLRAVRIADGAEAWTVWMGGAIMTAPAFHRGRLYVAAGDGWVTCLDAATGTEVWRWRAAPAERRMMLYSKLASSWPVISLLADEGTIYGIAGIFDAHGDIFFALDAETGTVLRSRWQRDDATLLNYNTRKTRPGRLGYLALVGRDAPMDRYRGVAHLIDAATGLPPAPDAGTATLLAMPDGSHQDCIVVPDRVVMRGGSQVFDNPDIRRAKSGGFSGFLIGDGSRPPPKKLFDAYRILIPKSIIAPALDGKEIALPSGLRTGDAIGLSLWTVETWLQAGPGSKDGLNPADARWAFPDAHVSAVVLAPDAVVAVIGIQEHVEQRWRYGMERPRFLAWRLIAYERGDGRERWSVNLPGEPILNGLAPAADGSWVLTLRDGSLVVVGNRTGSGP